MTEQTKEQVTAQSYTLYTDSGAWLGQVVLTSDGMFASVTFLLHGDITGRKVLRSSFVI